jgi:hypothetical protein
MLIGAIADQPRFPGDLPQRHSPAALSAALHLPVHLPIHFALKKTHFP